MTDDITIASARGIEISDLDEPTRQALIEMYRRPVALPELCEIMGRPCYDNAARRVIDRLSTAAPVYEENGVEESRNQHGYVRRYRMLRPWSPMERYLREAGAS